MGVGTGGYSLAVVACAASATSAKKKAAAVVRMVVVGSGTREMTTLRSGQQRKALCAGNRPGPSQTKQKAAPTQKHTAGEKRSWKSL